MLKDKKSTVCRGIYVISKERIGGTEKNYITPRLISRSLFLVTELEFELARRSPEAFIVSIAKRKGTRVFKDIPENTLMPERYVYVSKEADITFAVTNSTDLTGPLW